MIIEKKIWPKYFRMIKQEKKHVELRLANFKIKAGDILVLEEWDPEKKVYTGKTLEKKVKKVTKVNIFDFYKVKDLRKYGCYLIEF